MCAGDFTFTCACFYLLPPPESEPHSSNLRSGPARLSQEERRGSACRREGQLRKALQGAGGHTDPALSRGCHQEGLGRAVKAVTAATGPPGGSHLIGLREDGG